MSHKSLIVTFRTDEKGLAALAERVLADVLSKYLLGKDVSAEQYLILNGGLAMMERKEIDGR